MEKTVAVKKKLITENSGCNSAQGTSRNGRAKLKF